MQRYTATYVRDKFPWIFQCIQNSSDVEETREILYKKVTEIQYTFSSQNYEDISTTQSIIVRDCARAFRSLLAKRSEEISGISFPKILHGIAHGVTRDDLQEGFFAELAHLLHGLSGSPQFTIKEPSLCGDIKGREAAIIRSQELDEISTTMDTYISRYETGLSEQAVERRISRKAHILRTLGADDAQWNDWRWHMQNILKTPDDIKKCATLLPEEESALRLAHHNTIPFAITPYYASLLDDDPQAQRDLAVRAQVIPGMEYVQEMRKYAQGDAQSLDFMREADTSPVDCITRRYPRVVILKPFNTCPQICVYCQRNWEIKPAMAPNAMARKDALDRALQWIRTHPAIKEVLVTGGDPLALGDSVLMRILQAVAAIDHVECIRIGTRIPVTLPMRITDDLARFLGSLRQPGRREVCVMTHVEHVAEVTPEFVAAVNRLKTNGVSVYNQLVYTFYVSRKFEAAALRTLLRKCGVDPYYTFVMKGKKETDAFRVPMARILQEQQEEARLLPGLHRTDAPVFNVPGLGKNYVRALQNRDLVAIKEDGARVYEFHPWEKNIVERESYVGEDIPILEYLAKLQALGENLQDYASIWYYY
ncbi:MAG: lysine 2,3-aminomutase [Desulfomicrobiaceae bacterium]|nr:lysine 2,3-aminomutase [Desulfomicrobiaceae bacterium]